MPGNTSTWRIISFDDLPKAGVYVAVFALKRQLRMDIRSLGPAVLAPGLYAYVGSAQRNLAARLARHSRHRKKKHWHIDHLSCRAQMVGAFAIEGDKSLECRLATALTHRYARPIRGRGFGATDCGCGGHLFLLCEGKQEP